MGVPKFFRWISERYPLINQTIDYEHPGPIFDNLYLDMNGIIHNCSHANVEDIRELSDLDEDKIFVQVFQYLDRLFNIIKPRKLLYMAVDGVAPRAKMNQQRQRRFRSARDRKKAIEKVVEETGEMPEKLPFDSNCITPGTPFMWRLSDHLRFFIKKKIAEDYNWKQCDIIFSGPEVPGEGEHKIMDHIRYHKSLPDWDPNQSHCIYGLDADLIMLSLVTHEPFFSLLREEGVLNRQKEKKGDSQEFHLLHISVLREYLNWDFHSIKDNLPFKYDLENIIDDWIFLCFLVGNDFLPNLPGLDIAKGSLNSLFDIYKELVVELDGYIMERGCPVVSRLEKLFKKLSGGEEELFLKKGGSLNEEDDNYWKKIYYNDKFSGRYGDMELHHDLRKSYLKTLIWVSKYYYYGVPSWKSYYPYHYPPLISDLVDLEQYDVSFGESEPFKPYQQLIGVLPPASADFLPDPYKKLIFEDEEMIPFYPEDFELDMNDKKQDWEAIVLIPWLPEELIIKKTNAIDANELSQIERNRNNFGQIEIYYYDDQVEESCKSTVSHFDDIENTYTRIDFADAVGPLPDNIYAFKLLADTVTASPGTVMKSFVPLGFPSLFSVENNARVDHINVNVFGHSSKQESMVLELESEEDFSPKFGSIWVWPENREALVTSYSTKEYFYTKRNTVEQTGVKLNYFLQDIKKLKEKFYNTKAVDTGEITTLVKIRRIVGLMRNEQGNIRKRFSEKTEDIPLCQIIDKQLAFDDPRYSHTSYLYRPSVGDLVVCNNPRYFGSLCKITNISNRHEMTVKVLTKVPSLSIDDLVEKNDKLKYFTGKKVARILGIKERTLNQLCGCAYFLDHNSGKKYNFGLNLKFSKRRQQVMHYTKKQDRSPWEYSELALTVLKNYKENYPEVFLILDTCKDKKGVYDLELLNIEWNNENIGNNSSESEEVEDSEGQESGVTSEDISNELVTSVSEEESFELEESTATHSDLIEFLKTLPCCGLPRVPIGSIGIQDHLLEELLDVVNGLDSCKNEKDEEVIMQRRNLIHPLRDYEVLVEGHQYNAFDNFAIGDRVVYLRDSGPLTFGTIGTIIGIKENYLELLLDKNASGGITLENRVPAFRGQVVSTGSVLNLDKYGLNENKYYSRNNKRGRGRDNRGRGRINKHDQGDRKRGKRGRDHHRGNSRNDRGNSRNDRGNSRSDRGNSRNPGRGRGRGNENRGRGRGRGNENRGRGRGRGRENQGRRRQEKDDFRQSGEQVYQANNLPEPQRYADNAPREKIPNNPHIVRGVHFVGTDGNPTSSGNIPSFLDQLQHTYPNVPPYNQQMPNYNNPNFNQASYNQAPMFYQMPTSYNEYRYALQPPIFYTDPSFNEDQVLNPRKENNGQ
eukprot:TRINITY_DN1041_c0_g1_i1.p1 TRINITY_DN1041_c0_g1~~TRINITY_DN1041_c0_g1_i1.p1  ORF type:complete len:1371 (+),score=368.40 TRINITY_DN1041_c0_g1_i1:25-4137(+)